MPSLKKLIAAAMILSSQSAWSQGPAWESALKLVAEPGAPVPVVAKAAPVQASDTDAFGRPVTAATRAQFEALIASVPKRQFTPLEKSFLLSLLNERMVDPGPFKHREDLVRHFVKNGIRISPSQDSNLKENDLWRLAMAARAASVAYRIPPAILMCLTFRESSFDPRASGWTTSAKGVAQLTNGTVDTVVNLIKARKDLREQTEAYARLLGAKMPDRMVGTPDVDALSAEIRAMKDRGATKAEIAVKEKEKRRLVASHKDEPGHIFNLETNFGLGAAYLAHIRRDRYAKITDEIRGWLTSVGAYNQGPGITNELINKVYGGFPAYNQQPVTILWDMNVLSRLSISHARQEEMAGEVRSVHRCAVP